MISIMFCTEKCFPNVDWTNNSTLPSCQCIVNVNTLQASYGTTLLLQLLDYKFSCSESHWLKWIVIMPSFCLWLLTSAFFDCMNADHHNPKNHSLTNNTQPKSLGPGLNIGKISESTWERQEGVWIMKWCKEILI